MLERYLLEPPGAFVRDRYEFTVYRQLRHGLEASDLHCRHSARFRSFDDDLIARIFLLGSVDRIVATDIHRDNSFVLN